MDGLDTFEIIYLICFFLGLGFAIISGLLSGVFSGGAEGVGELDLSHDLDAGGHEGPSITGAEGSVDFSPVSPVTIAMFIATFGGVGMILKKAGLPGFAHVPLAAVSGFVVAGAVFYFFYKVFSVTGASSAASVADIIGTEAQVTTRIALDQVGQIAYSVGGSRFTAPARAVDGKEIGSQSIVKIVKLVGNMYYVERVT